MGASVSTNLAKSITNVVSKSASEIIQNTNVSSDQSQIISVSDVDGDVIIDGASFSQVAKLNISALMDVMNSSSNQQKIVDELAQQAKAALSGINTGQVSVATSVMDRLVFGISEVISTIGQKCSANSSQSQLLQIQRVKGNVKITNSVFDQVTEIFSVCTQKAVADNKNIQDALAKLTQASESEARGISEWAFVGGAALALGIPVAGGTVLGLSVMNKIFPLMLIIGIAILVYYEWYGKISMSNVVFSSLIKNNPSCQSVAAKTYTQYTSAQEAEKACLADANCKGYDYESAILPTSLNMPVIERVPPMTTFYNSLSCSTVAQDNSPLTNVPILHSGVGGPPSSQANLLNGDLYLDTSSAKLYQLKQQLWEQVGSFVVPVNAEINWGLEPPQSNTGNVNSVYIQYLYSLKKFIIWMKSSNGWTQNTEVPASYYGINVPKNVNVSGIKTSLADQSRLFYLGLIFTGVGAIGSIYTFTKKPEESRDKIK